MFQGALGERAFTFLYVRTVGLSRFVTYVVRCWPRKDRVSPFQILCLTLLPFLQNDWWTSSALHSKGGPREYGSVVPHKTSATRAERMFGSSDCCTSPAGRDSGFSIPTPTRGQGPLPR